MANQDVVDLINLIQHDIPDAEQFCSLDHIEELPAEYGDPFIQCMRKEALFDSPLAFHQYCTEVAVKMLAMKVGNIR